MPPARVIICATQAEALAALDIMFDGSFGAAGSAVVIEEFLEGEEASYFALTDGTTVLPFGSAQDHKRVGDGDTGRNTGGMGAYSPAPVLTAELEARAMEEIVRPTVKALAAQGNPYSGILYAGLMLTGEGPKLIEYNVRFGDPECQVLMMRLESDLLELIYAVARGRLAEAEPPRFCADATLTVVMAANGYPGPPETGGAVEGLDGLSSGPVMVFHAGTGLEEGRLVARGGRVLNVTAPERRSAKLATGPMRRWAGSASRRASAGPTSAGGRSPGPARAADGGDARPRRRRPGCDLASAPLRRERGHGPFPPADPGGASRRHLHHRRLYRSGAPRLVLRRSDVMAAAAPPAPLHFIFHSAMLLDRPRPGGGRRRRGDGLKEPLILNDMVGWRARRRPAPSDRGPGRRAVAARPALEPGETIVVKPSNILNGLAPAMLGLRPQSNALLLYAPLPDFFGRWRGRGCGGGAGFANCS